MTTGRRLLRGLIAPLLLPAGAVAQTAISPDAFLDAVIGKTVTFYEIRSGQLVGTEQFLSRNTSVWRENGLGCVYGQITTPNGQICFLYDNDTDGVPVCWWPFLHHDRLLVRLATFIGGEIQEVRRISEDSLNCPSVPVS